MDAATLRARVEDGVADELDALGSRQLLDVLAEGDPTRRSLLAVAADSEHAARETFRQWAEDADERTRDAFGDLVDQETRHYDLVTDRLDAYEPVDGGPLHAYLRTREDPVERVGAGLVGRPLYTLRAHEQLAAFFAGRDERAAGRDEPALTVVEVLRSDTTSTLGRGTGLLETLCTGAADWERARAAAEYAVTIAYDDFRDGLAAIER